MSANLVKLPLGGMANSNADIAAHLREMADWLEEEDASELRNAFLIFERADGTITRRTCGQPCDLARAVGILGIAASRAANGVEDD
jgi:hypothetical protein